VKIIQGNLSNFFFYLVATYTRGDNKCLVTKLDHIICIKLDVYGTHPRVCGMRVNVQFARDANMCVHVHCTSTEKFAAAMNSMVDTYV